MHQMTNHVLGAFRLARAALPGDQYDLVLARLFELPVGVVSHPEQVRGLGGANCEILVVIVMLK